jgi:hypothetical protein
VKKGDGPPLIRDGNRPEIAHYIAARHHHKAQFRMAGSPVAQYAASQAREGFLVGTSVGFSPIELALRRRLDFRTSDPTISTTSTVRNEGRPHEVSLAPTPAYFGRSGLRGRVHRRCGAGSQPDRGT